MLKSLLAAAFIALAPCTAFAGPFVEVTAAIDRGDYRQAFELLRPLAEQGDALSQAGLGAAYYAGQGVERDHRKAEKWFRMAAKQGDTLSQAFLGKMARADTAESRADVTATRSLRVAAVPQESEAVKRIRKVAETGHAAAQNTLGAMYAHGKGVSKDLVQAYMWFNLAADQGYALARRNLHKSARLMTSAQIAQAQNLAHEGLSQSRQLKFGASNMATPKAL